MPKVLNAIATGLFFAVISSTHGTEVSTDSPYGVCAHLQRWEYDRAEEELKLMKSAGIDHLRFDFDWSTIEPEPGKWNFNRFDRLMHLAQENKITILPILGGLIKHDKKPVFRFVPEFLDYVTTVIKRYNGQLPYVELWNEQNGKAFEDEEGGNGAKNYTAFLISVYRKIKELNPEIKIVYGGTSLIPWDFIEESFQNGAAQAMDVMCIHPYRWNEDPEITLADDIGQLRSLMKKYGAGDKPIWFSEMGYTTNPKSRPQTLRALLPRLFSALGMKPETTTAVVFADAEYPFYTENPSFRIPQYIPGLKKLKQISLSELKTLEVSPDTLLILPDNESFPGKYIPLLLEYVRRGGRILSPGGFPFYKDLQPRRNGITEMKEVALQFSKQFHIGWEAFWSKPGVPREVQQFELAPDYAEGPAIPFQPDFRFFNSTELKEGDWLEPVLYGVAENYRGILAGVYHLNSDLKGKIAFSGIFHDGEVSEFEQSCLLPRTMLIAFASGVERIYWYSFRSTEWKTGDQGEAHFGIVRNNLAPKDAYHAYRTLSELHPAGSSRPELRSDGTLYIANWKTPGNVPAAAVWNIAGERAVRLKIKSGRLTAVHDHLGREVKLSPENSVLTFSASPGILYFSGVEL